MTGISSTYIYAAVGCAAISTWCASIAVTLRIMHRQGYRLWAGIVIGALLGPFAVIPLVATYLLKWKSEGSKTGFPATDGRAPGKKTASFQAICMGSFIVVFVTFAALFVSKNIFEMRGEILQSPMATALMVSGFMAGFVMAARLLRVAFLEALCVVAIWSWVPVLFPAKTTSLFTYGTATAYFAAILFAGMLLLLFALMLGGAIGYLLRGDGRLTMSFSYEGWIGRRYLMAKRSGHVVSLITVISVFAVTVGCGGMIVVMSVMNGFSSDLRAKIIGANAHIMVLKYGKDFREYGAIIKKTKNLDGIEGASPFILNEVMVSSENNLTGALIKGIDLKTVAQVSDLAKNMVEGNLSHLGEPSQIEVPYSFKNSLKGNDSKKTKKDVLEMAIDAATEDEAEEKSIELPGIVIGKEMSRNLKVFVGDVVNVVSPVGEIGPTGPVPKAKPFRIAGIFYSGMYEYDAKFAYVRLSEAQAFFGLDDAVMGVEYKIDDIDRTQATAQKITKVIGGYPYYTKDFMQMNRNLFSALKLEKVAMFIILTSLIFMASLLILVALIMVVIEKGKEIAILKSMGATDTSVMKIFVTYGLSIGSLGAFLGVVLGVLVCFLIQSFGIGLDPEVYYISHLPVKINGFEISIVAISAIVVSFLATIPPSLYAARLRPVEGLRYE